MRIVFVPLLLALFVVPGVFASPSPEIMMNRPSMISPHGDGTAGLGPARPMADVIKDATLPGYPDVKIGTAFEKYGYFKEKHWYETRGTGGNFYVDFRGSSPTGWFDFKGRRAGIAEKGVVLKFVIYPSGEYGIVMASKTVQTKDGKTTATPISNIKGVVDAIYANKKLDL
ncbi:hypothetical protein [Geomonas anaerohicana]|uniref:Uncharacterized protein n=1 Tax=Geomonas anaerohicana TaxID=2798583 RepID=A0ABS0YIX4_9BACT|nr:hypothetical protein [Geomonas anaerohicana]MBJ6752225.1 hypothetical protein [Geomonas anaerohicana]